MSLKQLFILTTISVVLLSSCKKGPDPTPTPPDTGEKTRADLTRDSIFYTLKRFIYGILHCQLMKLLTQRSILQKVLIF